MTAYVWFEDGQTRYGKQWSAPRSDESVWMLPSEPQRHEIAVLVAPAYSRATKSWYWSWRATWYEDHVRGDTQPHGVPHCPPAWAPNGCVDEDDNSCTLRCERVDCGLHVARPGSTQCWCDDE